MILSEQQNGKPAVFRNIERGGLFFCSYRRQTVVPLNVGHRPATAATQARVRLPFFSLVQQIVAAGGVDHHVGAVRVDAAAGVGQFFRDVE